jgi:hypothetical protein
MLASFFYASVRTPLFAHHCSHTPLLTLTVRLWIKRRTSCPFSHKYVGLARTVKIQRIWPYIWSFPCQKCCIHTIFTWFWPTLHICLRRFLLPCSLHLSLLLCSHTFIPPVLYICPSCSVLIFLFLLFSCSHTFVPSALLLYVCSFCSVLIRWSLLLCSHTSLPPALLSYFCILNSSCSGSAPPKAGLGASVWPGPIKQEQRPSSCGLLFRGACNYYINVTLIADIYYFCGLLCTKSRLHSPLRTWWVLFLHAAGYSQHFVYYRYQDVKYPLLRNW